MSRTAVAIGGPSDGKVITILHGATFVTPKIERQDDAGADMVFASYHWERITFGPGHEPIGFWVLDGMSTRQAIELLAMGYAKPPTVPFSEAERQEIGREGAEDWPERLASWPPGVPGVKPEPRSARVASLMAPAIAVFIEPAGGVGPHPAGVDLRLKITWQEALYTVAHGAFSGLTMDEVLLALLSVDVGARLGKISPPA